MEKPLYCPNCRETLESEAAYCHGCGLHLPPGFDRNSVAPNPIEASATPVHSYRALGLRTALALIGAIIVAAFSVTTILVTFSEIGLYHRIAEDEVSSSELVANAERQDMVSTLYLFAFLGSAVTFLIWLYAVSGNLGSLGVSNQRFSPTWAIAWWFVPLMNLFRPYQVIKEIWEGSGLAVATTPAYLEQGPYSFLLIKWWWGTWLISHLLSLVPVFLMPDAYFAGAYPISAEVAERIIRVDQIYVVAEVATLLHIAIACVLIKRISRNQELIYRGFGTL